MKARSQHQKLRSILFARGAWCYPQMDTKDSIWKTQQDSSIWKECSVVSYLVLLLRLRPQVLNHSGTQLISIVFPSVFCRSSCSHVQLLYLIPLQVSLRAALAQQLSSDFSHSGRFLCQTRGSYVDSKILVTVHTPSSAWETLNFHSFCWSWSNPKVLSRNSHENYHTEHH